MEQPNPVSLAEVVEVEGILSILVHEDEFAVQLRASALLLQSSPDGLEHDDVALARARLRKTNSEAINMPADFNEVLMKVDVHPAKSECFTRP